MCAPQLLNVPAAAERRGAGDPLKHPPERERMDPVGRKEFVCRSLFGPVDHEQLRKDLKLRLKEIMDQDRRRWNFDFQSETPMSGRFQWEQVPTACAAALYHDSRPPREVRASSTEGEDQLTEREADQENCPKICNTRKCPTEETPARRKRTRSKSAAKLGNYARITGGDHKKSTRFRQEKETGAPPEIQIINMFLFSCRLFREEEEDFRL